MPRLTADRLRALGMELFTAAGCGPEDARAVVDHLVESSLFGHDSHGTIRWIALWRSPARRVRGWYAKRLARSRPRSSWG